MLARLVVSLLAMCGTISSAQSIGKAPRKVSGAEKAMCSMGAICFSGRVAEGQEFRHAINAELEFVLRPGWTITVVPKHPSSHCDEFASMVNAPYRAHRDLYIDMSYGWTAEEEVSSSPRQFNFVTNCADLQTESARVAIVMWPYSFTQKEYDEALAKLGTSRLGKGRLWITDSKVTHAHDTADNNPGRIEWISFTVEILLPKAG